MHYFLRMLSFFPCYDIGFFVRNQVSTGVWVYFYVSDLIPLINLFGFRSMTYGFYYHPSLVQFKIRNGDNSGWCVIVQECFSYPGTSLFFHMRIALSKSLNICVGILMGIALNL